MAKPGPAPKGYITNMIVKLTQEEKAKVSFIVAHDKQQASDNTMSDTIRRMIDEEAARLGYL